MVHHRRFDVRHGILSSREWIRVVPSDCRCDCSYENINTTIHRDANAKYGADAVGATGNGATSRTREANASAKRPRGGAETFERGDGYMEKIRVSSGEIVSTFVSFGTVVRVLLLCHLENGGRDWILQRRGCVLVHRFIRRGSNHDDASVDVRFIFSLGRVRCRRRYEQQSTRPDHEVGTPRISLSFSADDVELYSRRVLLLDHEQLVFALPGDFVQVYDDEKISRHSRYLSLGELRFQPVEPKSQFG